MSSPVIIPTEEGLKKVESALTLLEIEELSKRDLDIASTMRAQLSHDYVPVRLRKTNGLPDHTLKSSEAIPQIPILTPTDKMCKEHEQWHESQGILRIRTCEYCRQALRDLIKAETVGKRKSDPAIEASRKGTLRGANSPFSKEYSDEQRLADHTRIHAKYGLKRKSCIYCHPGLQVQK